MNGEGLMCMVHFSIFIALLLISFCKSDDQLTDSKPLAPGDLLISQDGIFALGFFSPAGSNSNLYVAIWFHGIAERSRTVVWVANRDSPATTTASSAKLTISHSSDLVLYDSDGRTLWTTQNNVGAAGASAVLLDTGNLVLSLPNGTTIWQSFDHPTDTILPGMRFLLIHRARVAGRLVAWRGPDDPSTGDFWFGLDPVSNLQMVIWQGTRPYCRISVWNGVSVSGGMYASGSSSIVYQTIVNTGDEFYLVFTVSDGSPYLRIKLDHTGTMKLLGWNSNSSSWMVVSERPTASCGLYGSCGPNGYCDFTGATPACQCLEGFEPVGLNSSRGCQRMEELQCSKGSHFGALPGMRVPDKFVLLQNRSFEQCAAECRRNCSCTAYAYANLSSASTVADQSRCLVWTGELVDTWKTSNYGEKLYLRLADPPVQRKNNLVKIVLPVIVCLLVPTCIALVWICKFKEKWRNKEIQKELMLGYLNVSEELGGNNVEFPFVSFGDIVAATDNFSDSNMLGRGGFGKVYKGMLEGGKEVAVKRLSQGSGQGIDEFRNEVVLLVKLQHRNLVRLLGCCIHEDEKLLIYEYLPNKSLDAFLFDASRKHVLDWSTRFKIIKGVERGLLYLHQDSRLTIIHRDLKPSNILLDTEMSPKISDFGMARIFGANQQLANTTRVVGTFGYMSPEYVTSGAFSVKSDTYSFGVLLLEIVSGLKIMSQQYVMDFPNLIAYAWRSWEDGNATELVDSSVVENCPLHDVLRCIHVGLLCVQDNPNARPLMTSVVFMLENETTVFPPPKEPVYFAPRDTDTEIEVTRRNMESCLNTLSITTLEGR